jgi:hydrogenase maturation protein HypF
VVELSRKALLLVISGLVQGVGFRPFIARLAMRHGLTGYVKNVGGSEVEVWIEGSEENIEDFLASLYYERPPVAFIDQVFVSFEEPVGYSAFKIERSGEGVYTRSNIPPDFAICEDCLREVLDPHNRRYMYPFNSCAYCGPRFSMMYRAPYDRENTAMKKYPLCPECSKEYGDPDNTRRYHAQGISCPRDGPKLQLLTRDFEVVETADPIGETAKLIDEGYIVAVKGVGGYHIAALATDDDVVLELRKRKRRPRKPFAIMGLNVEVLKRLVYIEPRDEEILKSPQAPILLLPKRLDTPVSKYVSPDLSHEGVFIAYTALHYLLLSKTRDKFLIMTSGNVHGEPMCTSEECAKSKLREVVDYYLIHDREIVNRVDDSVLRKTGESYVILRRGRGYAPAWIKIENELNGEYVAFGGDITSAGAVGFEDKIVLTQYVGDLDSLNAQEDLLTFIEFLVKNYHIGERFKPIVAVDMHPRLHSRRLGIRYARERGYPVVEVQHHYAHVLGAAIDLKLSGKVVGVALDGVGWGLDGTIWGAEVLLFDTDKYGFKRLATIKQIPITSDVDVKHPIRLVFGFLASRGYELHEIYRYLDMDITSTPLKDAEVEVVYKLVRLGKYTPASSTGRLLDLVAAILNPGIERTYEGEPAIWLEAQAWRGEFRNLDCFRILSNEELKVLDFDETIDWVISNKHKYGVEAIARSFLYSYGYYLGELVVEAMRGLRVDHVVASGGAVVNEFIYRGLRDRLAQEQITVYLPRNIPPNDGGLAFGQVVAASLYAKDKGLC